MIETQKFEKNEYAKGRRDFRKRSHCLQDLNFKLLMLQRFQWGFHKILHANSVLCVDETEAYSCF